MSEIAGRMSTLAGGYFSQKQVRGSGVLLGGVLGVLPEEWWCWGAALPGLTRRAWPRDWGVDVTILERGSER